MWKKLFAIKQAIGLARVSDDQENRIYHQAFCRLRALEAQHQGQECQYSEGSILCRRGEAAAIRLDCGFFNKSDWQQFIAVNRHVNFAHVEVKPRFEAPQFYKMDGRKIALSPVFNVKYSNDFEWGSVVDLGAIRG